VKLVIRGECNTGKSVLWSRLQGCPFIEDYIPSEEIRVATINWSSRACEEAIIKVEVWDVVDKSRKKRRPVNSSLKLANSINVPVSEICLDAEFLDVYKSTAGVLFIYDITKPWTWDYVEREITKVPAHIPVLIVGNQLDLGHHRKVPMDKCLTFIEHFDRLEEFYHRVKDISFLFLKRYYGFSCSLLRKFNA
jgi:GTPase SAR1 family protein